MLEELTYLNFDLLVERSGDGYQARVWDAPSGQSPAPVAFQLPFTDLEIENFLLKIGRRRGMRGGAATEMTQNIKAFGGKLYQSLFRDELQTQLLVSLERADNQDAGLRIRLRLSGAPELTDLPWEYLYDPVRNRFLCLSDRSPLVRYLELPDPVRITPVDGSLRLLVLIANPSDVDADPLDVEQEWTNITQALAGLQAGGQVEIERLTPPTLSEMERRLRRNRYHMLHFIGHGRFDPQDNDGQLLLEDQHGHGRPTSGQELGTLLYDHRWLRLAVLNACDGARSGRTDPFAGTAQSLIQQGIPAVVAMQFEISDLAAIIFSQALYQAIADGYPVDAATAEARKAIFAQPNPVEWATPVLYLRAPDGRIFNINSPKVITPQPNVTSRSPAAPATTMASSESAVAAGTTHQDEHEVATDLIEFDAAGQGVTEVPPADDWAICCSGGGIRSAAYCLGALQSLDQAGVLAKANWILGVSGGCWTASSRALVAHDLAAGTEPHAYAPGTPEERYLRDNILHSSPNGATGLVDVLSLFLRAVVTFVIALAPLYALAHAWGWLLRWQGALLPSGSHAMTAAVTGAAWWLSAVLAAAGIMLMLYGFLRLKLLIAYPEDRSNRGLVGWAATLIVGLVLAMLAVPLLISWLTRSTGSLGTVARFAGFGARPSWSWPAAVALIAAVTAIARYCQSGLATWTVMESVTRGTPSLLTQLAAGIRQLLLPGVAGAVIVLVGAVFALLWTSDGAKAGFTFGQLLLVIAALVVVLLTRLTVNVNRLSMHDFNGRRLADAFAVTRLAAETPARSAVRPKLFASAAATRLSELRDNQRAAGEPSLVICGTANINAVREVPAGQGPFCVTFDADHVTLQNARALTSDYEALIGHRRSTLFDISAISGATLSPLMGSATRQAYRILFTAANVRLGVWLPHPAVVRDARQLIDRPQDYAAHRRWERHPLLLLAWYLLPHLLWNHDPDTNTNREARLWAHVLRLRLDGKWSGALWYRAMQPTLGLLWAQAAGRLSYRATWMYVTDGGHYDNLGLVEALRRGARNIVVLDASGDKADTWSTLGGAIALALGRGRRADQVDPTTMIQGGHDLAPGQVVRPWAPGRFRRSPGEPAPGDGSRRPLTTELPEQGDIWVCKLGWWTGAPWDVLAYARDHPTFPCDSNLERLYDAAEFKTYQELGAATVLAAAEQGTPPLKRLSSGVSAPVSKRGLRQQRLPPN